MARRSLPGLGLTGGYSSGDDGWTDEMNDNLLKTSVVAQLVVESMSSALPGSPTNGLIHIVPTAGANQWKIAARENGAWVYLTPSIGWEAWVKDPGKKVRWSGTEWADAVVGAVAAKDEGSTVVSVMSAINFVGPGVTVGDAGGGVATVTISGGVGTGGSSPIEAAFTPPPAASTWTNQNFDATKTHLADFTVPVAGVRLYEDIYAYGNTNALRAALKSVPGARWQATARLRRHTRLPQFGAFGLVVRDSAGGRSCVMGFNAEAAGIGMLKLASDTSYTGYQGFGGAQLPWRHDIWFRAQYDGTDCTLWHSLDGVWWTKSATVAAGTALWNHLTNAATHVGFGYNINNNGATDIGQEVDLLSWSLVTLP